jgi:hypothetical protein
MTRLLLTLLALLTGLVAQTAPAHARVCLGSEAEVGAVEVPQSGVRIVISGSSIGAPAARRQTGFRGQNCVKPPRTIVYIPTVQLGSDRSLD